MTELLFFQSVCVHAMKTYGLYYIQTRYSNNQARILIYATTYLNINILLDGYKAQVEQLIFTPLCTLCSIIYAKTLRRERQYERNYWVDICGARFMYTILYNICNRHSLSFGKLNLKVRNKAQMCVCVLCAYDTVGIIMWYKYKVNSK